MAVSEYEGVFTQIDENGNEVKLYPIPKNGGIQIVTASSTDGVAYTATVKGVTALTVGMKITIIPNKVSASLTPTLNVNGLGAKYIRMPGTYNTGTAANAPVVSWLVANKPVTVTWDGTQWETDIQRPTASSISGTVAVANGGTGVTTLDELKELVGVGTVMPEGYDLNNLTTVGFYSVHAPANYIRENYWHGIIVNTINNDSNYVLQIGWYPNSDSLYYRLCSGGTWSGWKQFFTSDNVTYSNGVLTIG